MSTFATQEPISVRLEVLVVDVRIAASKRPDTVVEVRPSDPDKELDVTAAEQTKVDYANGNLVIKGPTARAYWRKVGSVDVTIELPEGSTVHGKAAVATVVSEGRLGECRFNTSAGSIRLDQTGPLHLSTSAGDVSVDDVSGTVEISTGSGEVRIREIDGTATIKNSNGATWVGDITGDLRVNSANGNITVDKALATVDARTANGSVRVGEVVRGSVGLETSMGELEVGIREGTAAWLDVHTSFGAVRSSLTAADAPEKAASSVEVRARTAFGDILIHRA
jgi:DUF4097 and DUF4098 domain-containing protein YvlB